MNISELSQAILSVEKKEELKILVGAINIRITELNKRESLKFRMGDKVEFKSSSRGLISGTVAKINSKTIKVYDSDSGTMWRVSPSLLKKVA